MTIGILLADDQELMRMGFRMVIDSQPDLEVIGEASSGREAIDATGRLAPDVVLMDVRMPECDGVQATRTIVESGAASRIIILTTFDLDEYVYAGLRAGASGFLLKDAQPAELLAAIRAVASGDAVVSPRVTRRLLSRHAHRLPASGSPRRQRGCWRRGTDGAGAPGRRQHPQLRWRESAACRSAIRRGSRSARARKRWSARALARR